MTAFTVLLGVSSYFIIDHYREAELFEPLQYITASAVVLFPHHGNIFIPVAQCLYRRILAGGRRTHDRKLMDL